MTEEPTKRCSKCGEIKPLSEFYRLGRSPDGRQRWCKPCASAQRQQWYEANPARKSEHDARSYARNRGKRLLQVRHYQQTHPQERAVITNRWRKQHPDEEKSSAARRHARRRGYQDAPVEHVDLRAVFGRYSGRCGICGQPVSWETADFDHIIPLKRGGSHTFDNLQPAHRSCNRKKGDKLPGE